MAACLVRGLEQPHRSQHADRAATDDRVRELHRLAIRAEEAVGLRGRGRGLAPVDGHKLSRASIPVHEEGAAADPRSVRLDEIEHELDRDRRVRRAAARKRANT